MKKVLLIGHSDIRLFLKFKSAYIWLFVVPLAFIYFTGAANRGPGSPSNPRPSLLLDNRDTNFLSEVLLQKLGASGMNVIEDPDDGTNRGIRIPSGFTEKVLNHEPVELEFFKAADSGDPAAAMIEFRLLRAVIGINSDLIQIGADPGALQMEQFEALQDQPKPVELDARFAGRKPVPSGFNQSLPGNLVMFLMMNLLIFGGASISSERQSGVIRRLLIYPVSNRELVLGKVYGRFLLGLVQVVFFMVVGRLLFKLEIGHNLIAIFLGLAIYSWVAASLGVLIGSLVKNSDKTTGLCVLAGMMMGALGGCWWPMEIVPDSMKLVGHLFPTAWAMDLLHQLISFGGGFSDVLPEMGMLILFAAASNLAAAKWFRQ